jgi:SulP family sulfate permease
MRHVPFVDATGIQSLSEIVDDCHRFKTRLIICGMRENVRKKLQQAKVIDKLGAGNLFSSVTDFMRKETGRNGSGPATDRSGEVPA